MTASEAIHTLHVEHCNAAEIAAYLNTTERVVRDELAEQGLADDGVYRYVDAVVSGARR